MAADHTVTGERHLRVVLEGRPGGRIYEQTADGVEYDWGEITVWKPPHRLDHLWHLHADRADANRRRHPIRPGGGLGDRVEIEHSGWERLGTRGGVWRERNHQGWSTLLAHYLSAL